MKWLELENVVVVLGGREVLRGVSLALGDEFASVIGPSGCGKTTLARVAMGKLRPQSGTVRWDGHDVHTMSRAATTHWRRNLGVVFQDSSLSLNPRLSAESSIADPLRMHEQVSREKVIEALTQVGLGEQDLARLPASFSGGQRQRIAIARALITRPRILVLDEPVASLDPIVAAQIATLLINLRAAQRFSGFAISHEPVFLQRLCDRQITMLDGAIV